MAEPYPENADGDFYVEKDCCTLCDAPMIEAPQLFKYANGTDGLPDHCYVFRQPASEGELDGMLNAIQCAEFRCIRYRGKAPSVLERLKQGDSADVCDVLAEAAEPKRPWWRFW